MAKNNNTLKAEQLFYKKNLRPYQKTNFNTFRGIVSDNPKQ